MDWGPDLASHYATAGAAYGDPGLVVDLGPLGLGYILEAGGTGISAGRGAAASGERASRTRAGHAGIPHPGYAIFSESSGEPGLIEAALDGLRQLARNLPGTAAADLTPPRRAPRSRKSAFKGQ